jgi:Na+-transporting methylmalonyl-CoA/oxaloacetate decarboxylase beta subunit
MDIIRIMPVVLLVPLGAALMLAGLDHAARHWRQTHGPARALTYVSAFRRFALGACVIAWAIGWATDVSWLVAAATCIGIGEVLECSYYIAVMRWGAARRSVASTAVPRA